LLQKVHADAPHYTECQEGKSRQPCRTWPDASGERGDGEHNGEGFDHFDERKAAVTAGATVAPEIKWSSASGCAELPVEAQLSTGRWEARAREQFIATICAAPTLRAFGCVLAAPGLRWR